MEVLKGLRGRATAALVAGFVVCLLAPGAASAGTLDQQQTATNSSSAVLWTSLSIAQTFTAGITGGLDQVDLLLARQGSPPAYLTVEIRDVSGGVPGEAVLAARSVPATAITNTTAQFIPVQFNPPVSVVAGTQYAVVAYSGNPLNNWYVWYMQPGDPYPGGAGWFSGVSPPSSSWGAEGADFAFKTYVVPAAATPTATPTAAATATALTGQRAAALKKCKKKQGRARKRCIKRAKKLPV
jgi:hypothetical protein